MDNFNNKNRNTSIDKTNRLIHSNVNPFFVDLNGKPVRNEMFRTVFWGGNHLQFTWLSIPVGDYRGTMEVSRKDQLIWIKSGKGLVQIGNREDNRYFRNQVHENLVIFIPAGMWYQLVNIGNEALKFYSISPSTYENVQIPNLLRSTIQFEHGLEQTEFSDEPVQPLIRDAQYEMGNPLFTLENKLNQWNGATIIFQGDSMTDPDFNSDRPNRYPKTVCEYFNGTEVNYAIGGSTIAMNPNHPLDHDPIISRFEKMQDEADLIIIAAGTNDWYYSWTPLGDFDSRDNGTFYGALHNLCLGLKKKYKNKTILFMTPIMRNEGKYNRPTSVNEHGKTLKDYGNIIKEVCHFYSIPVLDMYSESGLFPFDEELALEYFTKQLGEGRYYFTHPNNNGQIMMAKRLIGYLKQLL